MSYYSNSVIIQYHITWIRYHNTEIQSLFSIMYYLGDTLFQFSHYFVLNYVILLSFHWILSMIEMISEYITNKYCIKD